MVRDSRRTRLLEQPLDAAHRDILQNEVTILRVLPPDLRDRLIDIARVLLTEKQWEGTEDSTVTDRHRLLIAAQAALPLLGIEHDYYPLLKTIVVQPGAYSYRDRPSYDDEGVMEVGGVNLGEAWYRGPLILSRKDAEGSAHHVGRGRNVVVHEFAHVLDMESGISDGTPVGVPDTWHEVMTEQYQDLQARLGRGERDVLRPYAATNVAEFFAVSSEQFFDAPLPLRGQRSALYGALAGYYGVEPHRWFT